MALGDITVWGPGGENLPPSYRYRTEAGSTAINAGEPVVIGGTGSNYVAVLADGTPTTTNLMTGVATSTSTHTASANGVVDVCLALPGVVFKAKAKSAATIDTDAELLAVLNDRVVLDLTAGSYTVDVAAGDAATNGIRILGGDIVTGDVFFTVMVESTTLTSD